MPTALHTVLVYPPNSTKADWANRSAGTDVSCLVDRVSIQHGRDGTEGQPEPAAATLDVSAVEGLATPAVLDIGAVLTVWTDTAAVQSQRFVGRVTDMSQGWDEAGAQTPDRGVSQVVAASVLADLGRRVVGDVPWPQELDGARVSRIMAAAGIALDPLNSDPGKVQVLARDVDSQPALDLAREVASDAGGLLWHTRSGDIRYADAEHRRGETTSLDLDACDIWVTPTWTRNTEGLINKVSLGYGATPEGGEQPRYLAQADASIALRGEYAYTAGTMLATLNDAAAAGQLLLVRNVSPVWNMSALPVATATLSQAHYEALLALEVNGLISVTGMPAAGSVPTSAALWVEGWREEIAWDTHDIELAVSGYCRTVPPPRWDDLLPTRTWDTTGSTITWDDAACLGPTPDLGRWNDVPASQRWDTVPPTVTWDTWHTTTAAALEAPAEQEALIHA